MRDWIANGVSQIIMTDVAWTGGIAESKRIAAMAEAYGLPIVFHNAGGPVAHMASLHLAAHVPNLFELEMVRAFYNTYFRELTDVDVAIRDGHVAIPSERPGLGVDFLPSVWARSDINVQASTGEGKALGLSAMGDAWSKPDIRL
jgi:L-alanine-DL-glutamate epimerase-like enolase superfamily enzyme